MNFWSKRGFFPIKLNMTKTTSDNLNFTTALTANRNHENENVFCRRVTVSLQAYMLRCVVTHSTPRCIRYSDKLPMKITGNCWNNSLWNHLSAKPGKQISLEFPGIVSLQIQVTTKDFESWIHYWTIPWKYYILRWLLTCRLLVYQAPMDSMVMYMEKLLGR